MSVVFAICLIAAFFLLQQHWGDRAYADHNMLLVLACAFSLILLTFSLFARHPA